MSIPRYVKLAGAIALIVALGGGYGWFENRLRSEVKEPPSEAHVIVTKSTNACFSDLVQATGTFVPRREAVVVADQEGAKVIELFVHEGDVVKKNQELARLSPPQMPGQARPGSQEPISLKAPAAGLVTEVRTAIGAPASPEAGPMFRISVNNEIELDAQVPAVHMLKLNPGATARISRNDAPDLIGRVRLVAPEIDRTTQLGRVRIAVPDNPSLKVGMFARASIDAKRSCGIAVPKTAIDHLTVQVVKGNTVETRKVRTGLSSDSSMEILEGLEAGEVIVANAGSSLHDGDHIKTVFADDFDGSRVR